MVTLSRIIIIVIHQILSTPLFRKFAFYIAFTPTPLRNYHNPNKPMHADIADDNSHYHYAIYLHLFSLLSVDACHQSSAVKNIFVFLKKYLPNPKKYLDYNLTLVNQKWSSRPDQLYCFLQKVLKHKENDSRKVYNNQGRRKVR